MANERMTAALKAKGYPYRYVYAVGAGHTDGRVTRQTLPDALEWLWQGYQAQKVDGRVFPAPPQHGQKRFPGVLRTMNTAPSTTRTFPQGQARISAAGQGRPYAILARPKFKQISKN